MPRRPAPDLPAPPASPCAAVVAVATSGGRDSLCLLHATLRAAKPLGLQVLALHVHHGLQPEADAWLAGLAQRCARWARAGWPLAFAATRLPGRPAAGDSIEAWARKARYTALAAMARAGGAELVLLAHHRDDQAETVLLQALRGAGAAGLAAMPAAVHRAGLTWARPWLDRPGAAIAAYAGRHRLRAVQDPSNHDPRYARSRLRQQVMPALQAAFPQADSALVAVARQAQEARTVLAEVAEADLAALGAHAGAALPWAGWQALPSAARRRLVLRHWLAAGLPDGVPETLVQRVADEWTARGSAQWPAGAGRVLRAYRGRLQLAPPAVRTPAETDGASPRDGATLPLAGWPGRLVLQAATSQGLPASRLARLQARPRSGGERFQRSRRGSARPLKKQYQAAGLPAWERDGPLLWEGDRLVFAPGLGIDARHWAPDGTPQWRLCWQPAEATAEAGNP